MKAIVNFTNGTSTLALVNSSYSRGGVHYYNLTINTLKTFLYFKGGETKIYTENEVEKLTYVMN